MTDRVSRYMGDLYAFALILVRILKGGVALSFSLRKQTTALPFKEAEASWPQLYLKSLSFSL